MSQNEKLMEKAKQAIDDLFSDTTVSAETAIDNLTELIDECEMKRSSLKP